MARQNFGDVHRAKFPPSTVDPVVVGGAQAPPIFFCLHGSACARRRRPSGGVERSDVHAQNQQRRG
jgi:hypothetical protein